MINLGFFLRFSVYRAHMLLKHTTKRIHVYMYGLRCTVVERRSMTGEHPLSYARPAADGLPFMWVNRPLQGQPTRPTQPFILSRSINEY